VGAVAAGSGAGARVVGGVVDGADVVGGLVVAGVVRFVPVVGVMVGVVRGNVGGLVVTAPA
jgi:hypothetical protein